MSPDFLSMPHVLVPLASTSDVPPEHVVIIVLIDKVMKSIYIIILSFFSDMPKSEPICPCQAVKHLHLDVVVDNVSIVVGLLHLVEGP